MLILLFPLVLFGKSYFYPLIRTDVELSADGAAHIRQMRTYAFRGTFSWAYLELLKKGADSIVFNRLAESTGTGWQDVGELELSQDRRSLYIKWWFTAKDEARTFLVDYTVFGAVQRFRDVAQFYWKVIEDEHERIERVETRVNLPGPSPGLFKCYVHSAGPPGRLWFNERSDQVIIEQGRIPKNSFVEVRVLAQPELFPAVPVQPQPLYRQILAEERQNFVRALVRKLVLLPLGLVLQVFVPLVLVILYYLRYGREPKIDYQALYEHEPPRRAPPLVVPAIMFQKPSRSTIRQHYFQGILATVLELATRGIITVTEKREGSRRHYSFRLTKPEAVAELDQFSRTVTSLLFRQVGKAENEFTDEELRRFGAEHWAELKSVLDLFDTCATDWWRRELGADFLSSESLKAYQRFMFIALAAVVIGAVLTGYGLGPLIGGVGPGPWIIAAALGFCLALVFGAAGHSILRWNEAAYLEHKRWGAFRKFLVDFTAIEQAPIQLLAIWDHYYTYAVVLGVARQFLKNVTRLAQEQQVTVAAPAWFVPAVAAGPTDIAGVTEGLAGFSSFVANFGAMMDSFSTGSATGGGFSGGGGGGGGGGSSGAG